MTTAGVDQLLLPAVPDGAVRLGPLAWLVEGACGGRVFIGGQLAFAWDFGDRAGRRLAAALLVRVGAASQTAVADAFDVTTTTVYRWRRELAADGAAGLVTAVMGPKGPSKLTPAVAADIRARRATGETVAKIAAAVGCSTSSVARTLAAARTTQPTADGAENAADAGDDGAAGDGDVTCEADTTEGDDGGRPVLPVLPDPERRDVERGLARAGLLDEAAPVFAPAARVPLAGLLLAVPALAATGLIGCATRVYGRLPAGFYGLSTMLVEAVFRALLGESRAEGAGRIDPAALGRVLGMDRAPEVSTIRRKMRQLAAAGKAAGLLEALARRQLADAAADDTAAVLYVDGHTRVYHGRRKIQKLHVSRLRFPAPATEETWICDATGSPVWMVMAKPGSSRASEIARLLPDVRAMVGDGRRILVGFDRGGWSPALFAEMITQGFDVLTWRKGAPDDVDARLFSQQAHVDANGRVHKYTLADTTVTLLFDEKSPDKGQVTLRQITKLDKAAGRQVHVLTSRTDLSAGEAVWKMCCRWREENYFRYGRIRFDLDAHDTYAASDDGDRMVPNPAKKTAYAAVTAAAAKLKAARIQADRTFLELKSPRPGRVSVLTNQDSDRINQPVFDTETALAKARAVHKDIPARLPLSKVRPGQQVLDTETKRITHAIRSAAFNTMNSLAATVRTSTDYRRAGEEAHNLIRIALHASGDIDPRPETGVLHVRLDPLPTPRATAAITQLCTALNQADAVFPGTHLKLHYTVKPDN